jgi:SSS family solute:Na+ symporter
LTPHVPLGGLDFTIFVVYIILSLVIGFWAGRHGRRNAKEYFLGDKGLPWYVVGTSMVAAVISSEHFIAQVGAGYSQGIVVAAFGWNAWIVYTLLIWIFLPYYMRTGLYTMPEFLERCYNPACRYIFAGFLLLGYVASLIAGPLFAGGVALESMSDSISSGASWRWASSPAHTPSTAA